MENKVLKNFLMSKNDNPKHTKRFIQTYQQTNAGSNSYLREAILKGEMIFKSEGQPNQKWHFELWYSSAIEKDPEFKGKNVSYWCKLRCPELMLWIAEVCGQEKKVADLVNSFKKDKQYTKNDRVARNLMIKQIKKEIYWDDIISYVEIALTDMSDT